MAVQAGIRIGVEGEREYRQALANINQQTKELASEMRLLESSFTSETSAQEKAAAKSSVFERQIENQSNKVAVLTQKYNAEQNELARLKDEMEKATAEYGENSKEAEQATAAYNKFSNQTSKTKTDLNRAQTELNNLTKKFEESKNPTAQEGEEIEEVGKNLDEAGKQGSVFGDVLKANVVSEAIIGGVKALGRAIVDVGKGIASTVSDTVQWADDLQTLSTQTGISTQRLQELEYMSELIDVDVDTITGSLTRMTRNLGKAAEGTGDAAEAFAALGISVTDSNGELRSAETIFNEAIDALGGIENATERDTIAMAIFGRSAQELNPLIAAGSETLAAYAEEAHNVGYVLDEEMLDSMIDTSDALERIQKAAEGTKRRLVAAFAPQIANALERITPDLVEMGISLSEVIGPAVDALADGIKWVTDALNRMDAETKASTGRMVMLAAALAPTVPILSNLANIARVAGGALAAMVSNPALLGIAAGAAAIGGIAVAIAAANEASRARISAMASEMAAISEYTAAEQTLLNSVWETADAMNASRAATQEAAESLYYQRGRAYDLVAELQNLSNAEGYVAESDRDHAQIIIDELARAYGIEIEMIDGQIQGYDTLTDSIYAAIDAKTAEALLDRGREDYLDALQAEQGLVDALATAHNNAAEAEQAYNDALADVDRLTTQYQENLLTMTKRESDALEEQIAAAQQAAETAHENWMQSLADEADFNRQYLENSRAIQNYDAAQLAAQRGNTQEVINLMTGRANAWHDYGDAVDAATAQALDDMYDEVVRAAEYAAEVRTNWENGVDGYTESMVREAEASFQSMRDAFSDAYDEATNIGFDFMSGLDNGLQSQKNALLRTVNSIAGAIPHGMRDVLNMHSPSRVAEEIGELFTEGLVIGLDKTEKDVSEAAMAQADDMVAAFAGVNDVFGSAAMGRLLGGGAASNSVNYGGVQITVNANDEMTAQEIAEAVMEQMQAAVDRRGAVYA